MQLGHGRYPPSPINEVMPISIVDPHIPHRYGTGLNSYHPARRLVYQGSVLSHM